MVVAEGVPTALGAYTLARKAGATTPLIDSIYDILYRDRSALSALKEKPIVIVGGADKGVSFEPLARSLCDRASGVVITGACRDKILAALESYEGYDPSILPTFVCPDFKDAVDKARDMAVPGDTVLLSPACTSFDAFRNFEERGNTFVKIVISYK